MIWILIGIVLVIVAFVIYAVDNELVSSTEIKNNFKTLDTTQFFENGTLIGKIAFLGQPEVADVGGSGVFTLETVTELDGDCKDQGDFYFNTTTNNCEPIPVNQTITYIDNTLYTVQGQTFGHDSQSNFNPSGKQLAERSEWIVIPNPVYVRGFLEIEHPLTGEPLKERFTYRVRVTCEDISEDCYRQGANEFTTRGTTLSSGYFEEIFYPRQGFDKPGEYLANIEAFSETRDINDNRIPISKDYTFYLIDPKDVT